MWKAVNIALNKSSPTMPNITTENNVETRTDKEKANAFAEFFENKVKTVSENARTDREVYNGQTKIFGLHQDDWITEDLVSKVIDGLSHKRCQGYDRIPLLFLVDGKEKLLKIITVLMSKVINMGIVPEQWKIAKVKPLHKKGNKKIISNYRPISNLSSITKIFEKLILERIAEIETRENCDLTGLTQHGFKKKL